MKTSVALCTFNGEKYLEEQLNSILNQEIAVDQIIICDDGSTDNTAKILHGFQQKYPELFTLNFNEKSLGITKNFEKAINLCTNEIVFLADQDDIWFPEKTRKIVSFFNKNPNEDAVFHNLQLYKNGIPQKITQWDSISFEQEFRKKENLLLHSILFDNVVTGAAFAFRKRKKYHFKNPEILHDEILALEFSTTQKLGILDECLGYYRLHDKQQVGTNLEKNDYQKTISQWQENYYHNKNLPEKLKIMARGIEKLKKISADFPEANHKIFPVLKEKLLATRNQYLQTLSFAERKKTLLSWYKHQKYFVTFSEVLIN